MGIEITQIAVNHYAPNACDAINLYSVGGEGGSGLTLGQLTVAVCMTAAAAYEAQSVLKMNKLTSGSGTLTEAAAWLEKVADGSADWNAAKAFCIDALGIDEENLPDAIDTYKKRMQAVSVMEDKIDSLTQSQQEDMIDLRSLVNRRDVTYSTSTNILRTLYTSSSGNAGNF